MQFRVTVIVSPEGERARRPREEPRGGAHALFAFFEAADVDSAYLQLPSHPGSLAPRFVASVFGDHALHGCGVTMTLALPSCGIGRPDAHATRVADEPEARPGS